MSCHLVGPFLFYVPSMILYSLGKAAFSLPDVKESWAFLTDEFVNNVLCVAVYGGIYFPLFFSMMTFVRAGGDTVPAQLATSFTWFVSIF